MDFCAALRTNDRRTLAQILDPVLAALDPTEDDADNFETVGAWLARHTCVEDVRIAPGVLRSDPPIKQFVLTLKGSGPDDRRTIGLRLEPSGYRFNAK